MQRTHMVWAKKWRLLTPESVTAGTFKIDGQKEEKLDFKLLNRDWVEVRNGFIAADRNGNFMPNVKRNNEWYEIDEEESLRLDELRQENIKKKQAKKKIKSVSADDLVTSIVKAASANAGGISDAEVIDEVNEELEEARERWAELKGKKPHHAKKLASLNKEIAEMEADQEEEGAE